MVGIKDMGMPFKCSECKFCINKETNDYGSHGKCVAQNKIVDTLLRKRNEKCPLIEVENPRNKGFVNDIFFHR